MIASVADSVTARNRASLWRSACSAAWRSVTSRVTLPKPIRVPSSSRTAVITTLAQNRLPSLRMRQPSSSNRPSDAACDSSISSLPESTSSGG